MIEAIRIVDENQYREGYWRRVGLHFVNCRYSLIKKLKSGNYLVRSYRT